MKNRTAVALVPLVGSLLLISPRVDACKFTPLPWQQRIEQHFVADFVDQRKHFTWTRDRDRTFIDDEIENRFAPGEIVDVIVNLNDCMERGEIVELLSKFGKITYIGKLITFVMLDDVRFEDLPKLASLPPVAMIEWQAPLIYINDVSSRTVQSRTSNTFSPNTAQDSGFTGAGVNIAIVDSGVDDAHETFAGKWVAGFDASRFEDTNSNGIDDSCEPAPLGNGVCTDANDEPADGTTNPADVIGHGTHVAGIALGGGAAGRTCSNPGDGSVTNCAGVAPGAGLVEVKIDNTGSAANAAEAIDWVGLNAATFGIRVANMSFAYCVDDDGTSALAQQASYLASLGVVPVIAHGNASNCGVAAGTQLTSSPGSSSFAVTVGGVNDSDTLARGDDTNYTQFLEGPRNDFTAASPNLLALKPDLSAPGQNIFSAQSGSTSLYSSLSGTSMASPQVAGAAAVILDAQPGMPPDSLKDLLKRNADTTLNTAQFPAVDPTWDDDLGAGMLDVWAAVNAAAATDIGFPTCVGPPTSAGKPCALTPPLPSWNNTVDISTSSSPQVSVATTITAQVRNGTATAATVLVNFGVYVFAAGNNQFFHIGTQEVTVPGNTTIAVNQPWTPAASNHQCVQVSIAYGLDTDFDNNVTQRNLQVAPSVYNIRVENPYPVPAEFELEVKSEREGWICRVKEEKFALDPYEDCPKEVEVLFDPPRGAEPGERAVCDIGIVARRKDSEKVELIGGVSLQTFVPRQCRMVGWIRDSNGRPIPDARLTMDGQREGVVARSDEDGVFSLEATPYTLQTVAIETKTHGALKARRRFYCGVGTFEIVAGPRGLALLTRQREADWLWDRQLQPVGGRDRVD